MRPNFVIDGYRSNYYMVVSFGQLLLIPGFAALFSRLMYGPVGWGRRALTTIATAATGVVVSIFVITGFALLLEWIVNGDFGFGTPSWISSTISISLFMAFVAGILWLLWIGFKRSATKSIELESARWLAERRSGVSTAQRRWRNRGIGWGLCVPAVVVLLAFLFLPESEQVLYRLGHPHDIQLGDYKVRVPASWLIIANWTYKEEGRSGLSGLVGIEVPHEFGAYIRGRLALSEWTIELRAPQSNARSFWKIEPPVSRRVVPLKNESVVCLEYKRPYYGHRLSVAVECSGPRGLHASIVGEQSHVREFYRAIEQITVEGK